MARVPTSTTSFGASRREGHDSSAFYARSLSGAQFTTDSAINAVPPGVVNRVFEHTAEDTCSPKETQQ